ncbi:hypothetical protein BDM02DRAFT_3183340 [Thelephora ganbajun]|uniref:Uncharacterized protein n=1 Tax=Thelephora ganbajun TaxID=370292 RepID=A0ACB6ZSU9_THEGA|nr:hypothetical protein BDM02DRAFT_3183340 [Thelephora ganbajun]
MTPSSQNPLIFYPRRGSRHESVHRSMQLEIRVFSPAIKSTPGMGDSPGRTLPVFGEHDEVAGVVLLDPRYCTSPGRITVTLEGNFTIGHADPHDGRRRGTQQHMFFTSSQEFYSAERNGVQTSMTLRETFANTVRPKQRKPRTSSTVLNNGLPPNLFPFEFDMPQGQRGQEMPPSFKISSVTRDSNDGAPHAEDAEVSYTITALWEANDGSDRALIEAPIIFQPETDFDFVDGSWKPQAWLELPLRTDRSRVPFQCAITLPNPASFLKNGQIPFFVVFTTQPRSKTLCREIAADATIAVSLLRKVTVNIERPYTIVPRPHTAPATHQKGQGPPSAWMMGSHLEEVGSRSTTTSILKRMVKSAPPRLMKSPSYNDIRSAFSINKELPPLPLPSPPSAVTYTETRTLKTRMSIGFPKRPRSACAPDEHTSLGAHAALPDGLYKGKVNLNPQLLPSIDWAGLNVKYYMDVSVLFGQDELRARVPVRIF